MPDNHIHIISFDIPYPANYGGVIDVFHKIRLLHGQGVDITLHCFRYGDRQEQAELEKYCRKVYYYKRKTGIASNLSSLPYIVKSRQSEELIANLLKDNDPILFEGKHTCFYLADERLKDRYKIYRACNVEHEYYKGLCEAEKSIWKKIFFYVESKKLKKFSKKLQKADVMLAISEKDKDFLQKRFPCNSIVYIPAFHPNDDFDIDFTAENYILYHGKLAVPENESAVTFLINNVFSKEKELPFVVAGLQPSSSLKKLCDTYPNVRLIENPDEATMKRLIQRAAINLLYTSQPTGLKLKLLRVLYDGKHCIANGEMLQGTGLENVCTVANTPDEIREACKAVMDKQFSEQDLHERKEKMKEKFSNQKSIEALLQVIYKE